MSGFFSGSLGPFWPHALLLTAAIAASFAVAAGIVLENPKWSLANVLVVGGVAVEAACTLLLFGFDEGISSRQQEKIVILETAVGGRQLDAEQITSIANALKGFAGRRIFISSYAGDAEGVRLALQLKKAVEDAGIIIADNEIGRSVVGQGMHGSYDLKFGVHMQAQDSERDFADAMANALDVYGKLKIEAISGLSQIALPHPTVGIVVGLRPL